MVDHWSCGVLLSVQKLENKLHMAARSVHNQGSTRGYSSGSKDQIRKKNGNNPTYFYLYFLWKITYKNATLKRFVSRISTHVCEMSVLNRKQTGRGKSRLE